MVCNYPKVYLSVFFGNLKHEIIEVTEDKLTIETKPKDGKKAFSVQLFKKVETEAITCKMDNGLLTMNLPKKGRLKPTKIKVN